MATVHLARVDGVGGFQKWVAIKRIHADLTEDDQFIKMFLDEARIAASISHPNVAQVFELGQHESTYWIAMEYLHGEPLREVMRVHEETGIRMSPELAARIVADAAEGLHAAHELRGKDGDPLNLVHRDVTPHNLFVTYDGTVKVVDFGIAKVAGRLSSTMAGTLKGKIAYMSPEQIIGKEVDRRADIFSLGVVLWELSTGKRLFRSESEAETLGRVRACIVPPPSMIVPSYAAELEAIVMRTLSKDPEARPETARELSRSLQQYLIHAKAFVGSEEISEHMTRLFADRVPQRDERLRWAAEVTNTKSLQQMVDAVQAPAWAPAKRRDQPPPATQREPRRVLLSDVTASTTERIPKGKDPLLETRREKAFRPPALTAPQPPAEPTDPDLDSEPPTMIATSGHAPSAKRVIAAAPQHFPADDDDEDAGDTLVVSEAEMMAAMMPRVSSSAEADDDDEAPTMALAPERMPLMAGRAMAAPGLHRDRVQRAPARPIAQGGSSDSEPPTMMAAGAVSVARAAARRPTAIGLAPPQADSVTQRAPTAPVAHSPKASSPTAASLDPATVVAEALAQVKAAAPAPSFAAAPAAGLLPPQAPQDAQSARAPMPPAASLAFEGPAARAPLLSLDSDIAEYARQRSRRIVIIAALIGGFFVLLGVGVLVWSLARG